MNTKPIILFEGKYTKRDLEILKETQKIWEIVDNYENQLKELFEILHPTEKFSVTYKEQILKYIQDKAEGDITIKGNWIYYPWSGNLIHTVTEHDYDLIRTNRNKYLITQEEQNKLLESSIGFAGLSIGAHFAVGMAYSGIGKTMKLAEFDTLESSNLNRIRAGIHQLGKRKINIVSQQIYEINPYSNLIGFDKGLNNDTLTDFIKGSRKPNIIFEAIDDFEMKIQLRIAARKAQIPLIMLTNLEDNLLIDVERYDLDPKLPLFNGLLGSIPEEILNTKITEKEKVKFAIQIVGIENLSTPILESLFSINKTLVGRPQLYSTVTFAGGIASYLARRIILNRSLPSGRKLLSLKNILDLKDIDDQSKRNGLVDMLTKKFEI